MRRSAVATGDAEETSVYAYQGSTGTQNGRVLTVLGVLVPMVLLGAALSLSITMMPTLGQSAAIAECVTGLLASASATSPSMDTHASALNVGMIAVV